MTLPWWALGLMLGHFFVAGAVAGIAWVEDGDELPWWLWLLFLVWELLLLWVGFLFLRGYPGWTGGGQREWERSKE